jgi:hypothetical protein
MIMRTGGARWSESSRRPAIMARLMMSAAVPCIGALMAVRSAALRSWCCCG